jgi:hypothetical protein
MAGGKRPYRVVYFDQNGVVAPGWEGVPGDYFEALPQPSLVGKLKELLGW